MYFSINAYKYVLGFDASYRLCKDATWKHQLDFTKVDIEQDRLFSNYEEARSWLDTTGTIEIDGKQANTINNGAKTLARRDFEFEIVAHRTKPIQTPVFTREQLEQVLEAGSDQYHNSLVIDYEGYVKLVPLMGKSPASLKEYPVRFETFNAGNGYVGQKVEDSFLEMTYIALLEAWAMHIETGRSFYRDYASGEHSEEELIAMICN